MLSALSPVVRVIENELAKSGAQGGAQGEMAHHPKFALRARSQLILIAVAFGSLYSIALHARLSFYRSEHPEKEADMLFKI